MELTRRAAASRVQTTLTAVTGVTVMGGFHGALRGPEPACADQGPSSALGAPSRSLTLAPASLFWGSVAHVLLAIFPVYHLLAPFLACPMTLIPQLCELLQLGEESTVVCVQQQIRPTPGRCSGLSWNVNRGKSQRSPSPPSVSTPASARLKPTAWENLQMDPYHLPKSSSA